MDHHVGLAEFVRTRRCRLQWSGTQRTRVGSIVEESEINRVPLHV